MIKLLPRKEFELTLSTGEVMQGQFGTYAMRKFCDDRKIKMSEVSEAFSDKDNVSVIVEYVLCAVYQSYKQSKTKEPFKWEDVDIYRWVDESGGFSSEDVTALIHHAGDGEKKIPLGTVDTSP